MQEPAPLRVALVMEQTLGHVTHARNLSAVLQAQTAVAASWVPIPFAVGGGDRFIPVLRNTWSVRASWRARRALARVLRRKGHHGLFFHTQVTSLFAIDLMRRYPSVISLDATPLNYDSVGAAYDHRPAGNSFLDRRKYALNRQAFHAARRLVSWSEWARASLERDYQVDPARVDVLAPGAAPAYFRVGEERCHQASTAGAPLRVLFVGGDFKRKGGSVLLEALRGLPRDAYELDLVTGVAVPAQPNVHVHPGLGPNSPELIRLFATADVFVLPSLGECLAVVLMEATAAGLPVITTAVGALAEAVVPGQSGFVVRPADVADLRRALEALAADPERRRQMGRVGHNLAQQKFHAGRNNTRLLDIIATAAAGSRFHALDQVA